MGLTQHVVASDHPFSGWCTWKNEPFDDKAGPFFHQVDQAGKLVAAFKADGSHMNGMNVVHGGCLVTLADYSLYTLAVLGQDNDEVVTMSLNSEFIGTASEGDIVMAYPELVRRGGRVLFARGLVTVAGRTILSFSGTMMRLSRK